MFGLFHPLRLQRKSFLLSPGFASCVLQLMSKAATATNCSTWVNQERAASRSLPEATTKSTPAASRGGWVPRADGRVKLRQVQNQQNIQGMFGLFHPLRLQRKSFLLSPGFASCVLQLMSKAATATNCSTWVNQERAASRSLPEATTKSTPSIKASPR